MKVRKRLIFAAACIAALLYSSWFHAYPTPLAYWLSSASAPEHSPDWAISPQDYRSIKILVFPEMERGQDVTYVKVESMDRVEIGVATSSISGIIFSLERIEGTWKIVGGGGWIA